MIKVIICDDDFIVLKYIRNIVYSEFKKYESVVEIISIVDPTNPEIFDSKADIYFLDIDMPNLNGIDLAKKIQLSYPTTIIIFITNRDELVYDSLEANPFRFIRKSVLENDLPKVVFDALERLRNQKQFLTVRINREIIRLLQREISYIERLGNGVCIHMTNKKRYQVRSPITEMEEQVNHRLFLKVFPSILVNMVQIKEFLRDTVLLSGNEVLPVSRRTKEKARDKYMKFLKEE